MIKRVLHSLAHLLGINRGRIVFGPCSATGGSEMGFQCGRCGAVTGVHRVPRMYRRYSW